MKLNLFWILCFAIFATPLLFDKDRVAGAQSHQPPFVEQFLIKGELDAGQKQLLAKLKANPDDDQAKFELGILQFFQSVENLAQSMYDFGQEPNIGLGFVPFLRLPVPNNPDPGEVRLADVRRAFGKFAEDLKKTDDTLSKIKSTDVHASLHLFKFRLDFDNDGTAGPDESMRDLFVMYLGVRQRAKQNFAEVTIDFDRSDAEWIRGYCNLLSAMCEIVLAYDQTELWNTVAHRVFKRAIVKHKFFIEEKEVAENRDRPPWNSPDFFAYIADAIAGVHHTSFKIKEPERLKKAHAHLLAMIGHSRQMWRLIENENDKQNEWIPAPSQSNPFATQQISREMRQSWSVFLDESEALLKGEKLIPFWRGTNPRRGINLHKMFHEPQDLDVIDCVQGPGMLAFIEQGECTSVETWRQLQQTFRGNFVGFAIWIN